VRVTKRCGRLNCVHTDAALTGGCPKERNSEATLGVAVAMTRSAARFIDEGAGRREEEEKAKGAVAKMS